MRKLFLKLYDALAQRKAVAVTILLLLTALFAFLASRIKYEEDISKFLPDSRHDKMSKALDQLTTQNTIAIFFSSKKDSSNTDRIVEAMDCFGNIVEDDNYIEGVTVTIDESQFLDIVEAAYSHIPYLLSESDYDRIDSLLKDAEFIDKQLVEDKKTLMLPSSGIFSRTITHDPLHLFSPALKKLQNLRQDNSFTTIDEHVFTTDEKYGIVTFETPFGANESRNNALLTDYIDSTLQKVMLQHPDIEATAIGAPLIAVANAKQIKKDSIIAIVIAVVLIFAILLLHYRRLSDILWVGISLAFGALFALAGLSVIKDSVSIIVLGIGSVIIGIAANYPLHFLDDYKELGDRRQALSEMTIPLLIGNLTTVAAFLCLVWLDAQAMRDLGLFGSLMLVGTIIFVLIFLPHFINKRPAPSENKLLNQLAGLHLSRGKARPYIALAIAILTIVFGYYSTKTSFDSNLSHINYMTPEQRGNIELLGHLQSSGTLYAVAEGATLQEAVNNNSQLVTAIRAADKEAVISGLGEILPSETQMMEATERWNSFWESHNSDEFLQKFDRAANRHGFSVTAFHPFTGNISSNLENSTIDDFSDIIQPFINKYIYYDDTGYKIVNIVKTERKAALHNTIDNKSESYYIYSEDELGNKLVEMLQGSFDYIGLVCSIVVFIFLLISFRKLEIALLAFLPLAIAWVWILGIMHITGIQFNIVNIILATFIFGQGDDYTIFITEGLLYENTTGKERLASYKHSVFISALIMFAGIGCLIVAKHPALHSLAVVTIIGMLVVVLMSSFVPPLIFDFLTKKNGKPRKVPITIAVFFKSLAFGFAFAFVATVVMGPITFFMFLRKKDSDEKRLKYHQILQRLAKLFSYHTPGVDFSVKNTANEDFSKPSVIISNHQSHLDLLYLLSLSPKIVFLTNDWVWNNPIYKHVVRNAECYPVSEGFESILPKLQDLHKRGYSICVFPEGTRSPDCDILRFHKGAFTLARTLKADILPLYLHGAGHALPKEGLMLCPASVVLEIGERCRPYETVKLAELESTDLDRLVAKLMRQHYKERYANMCRELETDDYWHNMEYYQNYYKIKL